MRRILAQARKELVQIRRDRLALVLALVLPLVLLALFGTAISLEVKNLPVVVQDLDRTPLSRDYVEAFRTSITFRLVPLAVTDRPESALDAGRARAAIVIPQNFERDLANTRGVEAWIGMVEQARQRPRVSIQQLPVCSGKAAQVLDPVSRRRLGFEAAEDTVQERIDQLVLGREVAIQRHRRGLEAIGDRAQGERVEALLSHILGCIEDQIARERAARSAGADRRAARRGHAYIVRYLLRRLCSTKR